MSHRACEAVGIDLGTTYSSLAFMDPQMTPRVVCDSEGRSVMPSVVYFDEQEIIVGDMALSQAKVRADRVVQFIKVHMGDPWRKEFCGQEHTPESISALILGQLIREAEPQLGSIRRAVITVPAYFTEKRRRATQQAGEIAGLSVLGTLNEPMSASLAYGLHRTQREQFVVVYDLGGGTFDVTVVRVTPNELEELATNGNRQLGGRDWDQALIEFVCDDFQKHHRKNPRESPQAMQDLLIECESAKRRLGRMARTSVRFHTLGCDHSLDVTREQFESLTAHLLQSTKLTTELALEDAHLDWGRIARVMLVGGSTHMPAVRRMLKETSGMQPDTGVNPVIAVSLGAAIYAHMLETGYALKAVQHLPDPTTAVNQAGPTAGAAADAPPPLAANDPQHAPAAIAGSLPKVSFVTAHGVGVKVRGPGGLANMVLIPRNSRVPTTVTRTFTTTAKAVKDGRAVRANAVAIEITQGDTIDPDLAEMLGTGRILGLPPGEQAGNLVDVTMEFDQQGRLHTRAVYRKTGQETKMSVEIRGGLREEEVQVYREFLERTGFVKPFDAADAIQQLDVVLDEDDENGLQFIEPA